MTNRYDTELAAIWSREGELDRLLRASRPAAFMSGGPLLGNLVGDIVGEVLPIPPGSKMIKEWAELESRYDHDIAAFVELVRAMLPENWDDDDSGSPRQDWHYRRTSSDLVETALGIGLSESHDLLLEAHCDLLRSLCMFAWSFRGRPVMGRTHGQLAEPTSIGRKFAVLAFTLESTFPSRYAAGKVSGPVGTDTTMEDVALEAVDLNPVPSTQIVPRGYLARYFGQLAAYTSTLTTLATEIRLAAQHDGWLHEGRITREARGSSAMPQKRNPIRSERAVGLCELIRHNCYAVIEAGAGLWNERDISHSSVERVALPEALQFTHFVLRDLAHVVDGLEVDSAVAARGTDQETGEGTLADAVDAGVDREMAYQLIRTLGPRAAAEKMDVSGVGRAYDTDLEPELWSWVSDHLV